MINLYHVVQALAHDLSLNDSDVRIIQRRLHNEGPAFLTKTLPVLEKVLLMSLEQGGVNKYYIYQSCPRATAFRWKGNFPELFSGLFQKIFHQDGFLKEESDIDVFAIYQIRQVCSYFYKIAVEYDANQLQEAEDRFVEVDKEVGDSFDFAVADSLRKCVETNYKELLTDSLSDVLHKFGPSPTSGTFSQKADPRKITDVYPWYIWKDYIIPPHDLDRSYFFAYASRNMFNSSVYEHDWKLGQFAKRRPGPVVDLNTLSYAEQTAKYSFCDKPDYVVPTVGLEMERVSELLFVPKDSRGPRTIVREPANTLPLQMTFFNYLSSYIERKSGYRVNFRKQETNQRLAKENSITRQFSTLDLKEASDRVSSRLVSVLFQNCPALRGLLKFRTPTCSLPSGKTIQLNKLAGMGSGYTFASMAFIIHVVSAQAISDFRHISYRQATQLAYVYGDDIIVPTDCVTVVIRALASVGFRINPDKCFKYSHFRESCGADYFYGNRVVPLRLKLSSSAPSFLFYCNKQRQVIHGVVPSKGKRDQFIYQLSKHCVELVDEGFTKTAAMYYEVIRKMLGPNKPFPRYADSDLDIVGRYNPYSKGRNVKIDKVGNHAIASAMTYVNDINESLSLSESRRLASQLASMAKAPPWWNKLLFLYELDIDTSKSGVTIPRKGSLKEITVNSIEFLPKK